MQLQSGPGASSPACRWIWRYSALTADREVTERLWRHVRGDRTHCPGAWATASASTRPTVRGDVASGAALHDRRSARLDRAAAHTHGFLSARGDHPADDADGERLPALRSWRAGDL